jgi:sulfate adenylyltransferase subunit 1
MYFDDIILELIEKGEIPGKINSGVLYLEKSKNMSWYQGGTLMYILENIHISSDHNHIDARFPVQYVIRPQRDEFHDFRGYAGRVAGGTFKVGDKVMILPSGFTTTVKSIINHTRELEEAFPPMSVVITLDDDIDISRGDMIVKENNVPDIGQDIDIMMCWMSEKPMRLNGKYALKHTTADARCLIKDVKYKVDVNTLGKIPDDKDIGLNEIARVSLRTTKPLFYDSYRQNRKTGAIILIDEADNTTVGVGMII